MAKPKAQRLTLDLGERSWDRLSRLQAVIEAGTKVGVIQQALRLLEYVVDRAEKGDVFLARDAAGNVEAITILGVTPAGAAPADA